MAGFNPNFKNNTANKQNVWDLKALFGKYDGNSLIIKLQGFSWDDIGVLNNIDTSVFVAKKVKTKSGSIIVVLQIPQDKLTDFSNLLPQIKQQLAATGHYTKDSVNMFPEIVDNIIEKTASPDEIEQGNQNIIRNWKDLLLRAKDPEFRKKFLLVQAYPENFGFSGATAYALKKTKLSPNNITEILSQDPLATFITDAPTWRREFNRTVQPNAPFVVYTQGVPDDSVRREFWKLPQIVAAKKKLASKGLPINTDNIKREVGPQEYWGLWKDVSTKYSKYPEFFQKKGYDVRFTTPNDPNNDPFITLAKLVNNLTGELNQAAIDKITSEMQASGMEAPKQEDFNKKVEGIENQKELLKFKNFILEKCKQKKINVVDNGSTEDVISNAVYAYAYAMTDGMNQLTLQEKSCFAATLTAFICDRFNITDTQKAQQSFNIIGNFTDEKLEKFAKDIYMTFKTLSNFEIGVRESVEVNANPLSNVTFNDLQDFIKRHTKNRTSIKRDFDDINNRMDNLYKN